MKLRRAGSILDDALSVELAEEWDNSGWAVAQLEEELTGVLVCVDPTAEALNRAVDNDLNLVVAHHPLILDPIDSVIDDYPQQRVIMRAIKNDVAIYGAHTNVDSMTGGLNDEFAGYFKLEAPKPIDPNPEEETAGLGRIGTLPEPLSLGTIEDSLEDQLELSKLETLGDPETTVESVAICTGSGGDYISHPRVQEADLYITADVDHHEALNAQQTGLPLINLDHYEMEAVFNPIVQEICERRFKGTVPVETFRRENPFRRS